MGKLSDLKNVMEKIFIPSGNMGIPRRNMPQIEDADQEDFIDFLADNGVRVSKIKIQAKKIKPIQKEIRADVVQKLLKDNSPKLIKPVIISKDHYLLDGHHRWLAVLQDDKDVEVQALQANLNMRQLLELSQKFSKVIYKDTRNKEYNSIDPSLKAS